MLMKNSVVTILVSVLSTLLELKLKPVFVAHEFLTQQIPPLRFRTFIKLEARRHFDIRAMIEIWLDFFSQ